MLYRPVVALRGVGSLTMLFRILSDNWRILTFRRPSACIATHWRAYLLFGLLVTWLAGIGRYWDNPRAHLLQYLGLGSLAYVLVLAAVLWLLLAPLKPARWSFRQVLIFVTLCSPPALLYAIPVEQFMSLEAAQSANAWFLAIVATWRVALLAVFLLRAAGLTPGSAFVGTLLPICLIIVSLSLLNLEHVVFSIMSGIAPEQRSSADLSYSIVFLLSLLSFITAPFLLVWYGVLVYLAQARTT
jgi:hypothetical protein